MCENCAKSDLSKLAPIFKEFEGDDHALISMLQKAQEAYGYLPTDVMLSKPPALRPRTTLNLA